MNTVTEDEVSKQISARREKCLPEGYNRIMNTRYIPALVILLCSCAALPAENASSIQVMESGGKITAVVTVDGFAPEGIKYVWSKTPGPVYPPRPGDRAEYRSLQDSQEFTPSAFDGPGTYWVRAGWYDGEGISFYSNAIPIRLDGTGGISRGEGMSIRLAVSGQTAKVGLTYKDDMPEGIKIVWSRSPDPVYPPRDTDQAVFLERSDPLELWLDAFDGPGNYYVRAGWYSNGRILFYSTPVEAELR